MLLPSVNDVSIVLTLYCVYHFQVSFEVASSLNDMMIETHRRRHLAYLMSDQGGLVGNPENMPNLPKQHLSRSARLAAVLLHALLDCFFTWPGWRVSKFWS